MARKAFRVGDPNVLDSTEPCGDLRYRLGEFLIFGAAHVRLRRIPIEARSNTNNQSVPFYDAARHLRLPC
jgi:hypothetical protein